jgi:sulfatase modifying factor 1
MWRLATLAVVLLSTSVVQAVTIEWVTVGDADNVPDTEIMLTDGTTGYGGVDHVYRIGKYEVTNSQYAEFLNAVAAVGDPNHLYNPNMGGGDWTDIGGISRSGSGTETNPWVYSPRPARGQRPVSYVSWYDAIRFANWLHNGQPGLVTTVPQNSESTEDGAYNLVFGPVGVRKPGARVFLPSEDEWYKAAYYKGGGTNAGYWDYPTESDTAPTSEVPPGTDLDNGSANFRQISYVDPTYYTTVVGAYDATGALGQYVSDSPYGTFDQCGNAGEWNETLIEIQYNGNYLAARGVRGSSFSYSAGAARARARGNEDPTREHYTIGFRVASIPEPATFWLALVALAGMGALGAVRQKLRRVARHTEISPILAFEPELLPVRRKGRLAIAERTPQDVLNGPLASSCDGRGKPRICVSDATSRLLGPPGVSWRQYRL